MVRSNRPASAINGRQGYLSRLWRNTVKYRYTYLLLLPVLIYYLIFSYYPMYGAQIAFRNFKPRLGILGSPWVGLTHLRTFFQSIYASRVIRNTVIINLMNLVLGFPAPIILALLLNEVRNAPFKKTVQTISYLPHFVSTVVICGMISDFVSTNGLITQMITAITGNAPKNLLMDQSLFRTIYVSTDIWQGIGWGSIIYIAALSGIDEQLYEAAMIDGAGRWRQTIHITIPGIVPTIMIMLILRIGSMMSLGYEKVLLLYNPAIYETADIISTYVYRKGLVEMNYSFSSAIDLLNSVVNLTLLFSANMLSRRISGNSLW